MNTDDDTLIKLRGDTHSVWTVPRGTADFADGFAAVSAEPSNWGSFILRVLPKLVEAADHDVPVLAYVNHANQRLMAEFVGIRPTNLVHHETWLRYNLRNVQVPMLPTSAMWVSPKLKATYDAIADIARATHRQLTDVSRVYLSRRGYWGRRSKRSLVNEEQLIAELETRGFHILCPEDVPASLVAATVSRARVIVTLGGAGLFNVVFAPEDATVIDIEGQDTFLHGHTNILAGTVRRWGLFYGSLMNPANREIHQPFEIDVGAFLRALDEIDA
jgi:capsular polysaccharide biosynthesis protein